MEKPADQQQQPQTPTQTQNPPSTDTGSQTNIPSGWTDNGDGTYTDDNGGIRVINPATGDFYKTGDTNSQGWDYGTASDIFK